MCYMKGVIMGNFNRSRRFKHSALTVFIAGILLLFLCGWTTAPVKAVTFEEEIDSFTTSTIGKKSSDFGFPSGEDWCGYYVRYVLEHMYNTFGCNITDYVPYGQLTSATSTGDTWKGGSYGEYYSWTDWEFQPEEGAKRSSIITPNLSSCRPKPGDIILVETRGSVEDGPDHLGIIVNVDENGNSFITAEGNTSAVSVQFVDYVYDGRIGKYHRSGSSGIIVHAI